MRLKTFYSGRAFTNKNKGETSMPWIKKALCTGCQLYINECTVGAISMEENAAKIIEAECIRCGICHDVCPNDAVRHDGELIPSEVQENLNWAKNLLTHEYYKGDKEKQDQLHERLQRYFAKSKKIAEKTMEQLETLKQKR
jgi:formate hydrogenlyase subunit 6/NADH:ubiquinone oxidoreductase subunit I